MKNLILYGSGITILVLFIVFVIVFFQLSYVSHANSVNNTNIRIISEKVNKVLEYADDGGDVSDNTSLLGRIDALTTQYNLISASINSLENRTMPAPSPISTSTSISTSSAPSSGSLSPETAQSPQKYILSLQSSVNKDSNHFALFTPTLMDSQSTQLTFPNGSNYKCVLTNLSPVFIPSTISFENNVLSATNFGSSFWDDFKKKMYPLPDNDNVNNSWSITLYVRFKVNADNSSSKRNIVGINNNVDIINGGAEGIFEMKNTITQYPDTSLFFYLARRTNNYVTESKRNCIELGMIGVFSVCHPTPITDFNWHAIAINIRQRNASDSVKYTIFELCVDTYITNTSADGYDGNNYSATVNRINTETFTNKAIDPNASKFNLSLGTWSRFIGSANTPQGAGYSNIDICDIKTYKDKIITSADMRALYEARPRA